MQEKILQKIAVVSDIHGNILALEEVLKDIERRKPDYVINLGDHISGPLWPKETIELIINKDWINISGNHDRQLIEHNPEEHGPSDKYAYKFLNISEKEWFKNLPKKLTINNEIFLFHGIPDNDLIYLLETVKDGKVESADQEEIEERLGKNRRSIMLCGHSHIPKIVEHRGATIINPGSVGLQAYTTDFPEYHKVESGLTHARYALLEKINQQWIVDFISIPYDNEKAAAMAKKNKSYEWESALRTGYIKSVKKV